MTEHTLKTLPVYFEAIASGDKNFEVRRDDRGFQKGDTLILQKHDGTKFVDTTGGRYDPHTRQWGPLKLCEARRRITYILTGAQFGIEAGYVVMGLAAE